MLIPDGRRLNTPTSCGDVMRLGELEIQFCLHFTLRDKVGQNCETGHNVTGEGERKASQRAAIYVA